jgi:hypothetical protein
MVEDIFDQVLALQREQKEHSRQKEQQEQYRRMRPVMQ